MKIVTWNCGGGLRKKLTHIDRISADILIIQECEDPAQSTHDYQKWAGDYLWIGDSKNKGIGVFPKLDHYIKPLNWSGSFKIKGINHNSSSWKTEDLKLFLPFSINDHYQALGVWTKGSDSQVFGYIGQLWKYIQIHSQRLSGENQLIMGDFNSNTMWDKPDRWWNHSNVVDELQELGLYSLYHHKFAENHGKESASTFFLYHHRSKPYFIDYAFVSENLLVRSDIEIGPPNDWLEVSDHVPIIIDIT